MIVRDPSVHKSTERHDIDNGVNHNWIAIPRKHALILIIECVKGISRWTSLIAYHGGYRHQDNSVAKFPLLFQGVCVFYIWY